jgi:hypothetical protein
MPILHHRGLTHLQGERLRRFHWPQILTGSYPVRSLVRSRWGKWWRRPTEERDEDQEDDSLPDEISSSFEYSSSKDVFFDEWDSDESDSDPLDCWNIPILFLAWCRSDSVRLRDRWKLAIWLPFGGIGLPNRWYLGRAAAWFGKGRCSDEKISCMLLF